jgi:predicted O-methyltransferase YrrM
MLAWTDRGSFNVDDTEFVPFALGTHGRSTRERFLLGKPDMADRFAEILEQHAGGNIVELGIFQGGSAALAALVAKPRMLVAVDVEEERSEALDGFIADHHLEHSVRPFWGIDQADRERLAQIVADEFDGALDLVVDDASHQYDATVASFETLFPLLRPGGCYLIEDWRWGVAVPDGQTPLAQIAIDLLTVRARTDLVEDITIDAGWITVRRGPGTPDEPFRLERVRFD